jgi:hypothetical protein
MMVYNSIQKFTKEMIVGYDKKPCVVGDEFIEFLKETQKKPMINLQKKV